MDKSSYCRNKVIKVFEKLSLENAIPTDKYPAILKEVAGRLHDVATMVRKSALKFLY